MADPVIGRPAPGAAPFTRQCLLVRLENGGMVARIATASGVTDANRLPSISRDEANALALEPTPDDIGVIDRSGTVAEVSGQSLVVHRDGGTRRFEGAGR